MTKETARELWPEVYENTWEEAKSAAVNTKTAMFLVYDPRDTNRPIQWANPVCYREIFPRSAKVIEVVGPYPKKTGVRP